MMNVSTNVNVMVMVTIKSALIVTMRGCLLYVSVRFEVVCINGLSEGGCQIALDLTASWELYSEDESDSGTEDESGDDDTVDQVTLRSLSIFCAVLLTTVLLLWTLDYLLAGSWNIQEEIRRVRAKNDKFVVVGKDEAINLATPIPVSEIVTLDSDEGVLQAFQGIHSDNKQTTRNSSDRNGLEKEDNQENNKKVNDLVENNCYLMTESADIPPVILTQESTNNNDHSLATKIDDPSENRAVTRAGKNTRRGKRRGK
ncbi:hypothetical protein Tco_1021767 [Tanacetum coccineum]